MPGNVELADVVAWKVGRQGYEGTANRRVQNAECGSHPTLHSALDRYGVILSITAR